MLPRSAVLAALALAPVLAGCTTPAVDPAGLPLAPVLQGLAPATLRCPEAAMGACNLLTTLEPERQGNEVTIAVNPTDPANVVAGAKDYYPPTAGDCVWDGSYVTKDGATFASGNVPGSPWLLLNDPGSFQPTAISQYWCATDPVVAFGPDGTLYYTILAYQGDPVTASKAGAGVLPMGGVNDWAFNRVSIAVAISRDGGATYEEVNLIDSGSFPVNFHDRQWVEVDQRNGNVYVAWTTIAVPGNMFYRSTDGGRTWGPPVLLDSPPTAFTGPGGMFVATGAEDTVFVSGCDATGPVVQASTDGGQTFSGWLAFAEARDEGMEADYRSGMVCMVAADDTDGPHAGNVYMVWSDTRDGNRDIYFRGMKHEALHGHDLRVQDHDGPMEPVRLNDDTGDADQFFPAISVSPKGVIDVAWLDRRNDPAGVLYDVYHTYSLDGGRTWAPNARVSEVSSDPRFSHHQNGMVFIGDYIDIDSSETCAWPVWPDTRAGKSDVMTACVERPADPVP